MRRCCKFAPQQQLTIDKKIAMELPDLLDATIEELQAGLTAAYLARIEEVNRQGPNLRAVNIVSPVALEAAKLSDDERKAGKIRGMLHGIPIILKDHFPIRKEDGMCSTMGSSALSGIVAKEEAEVVVRLRHAGAIILGLANLGQWGYTRSYGIKDEGRTFFPMGWSSIGGQSLNPYHLKGCTLGSSSGSAIAAAVGLAAATIGSDLSGSIVLPAASQNVAAIRATVGLVSRANAMGASSTHDSLGTLGRSISDVAHTLQAISGRDERDLFTTMIPASMPSLTSFLDPQALRGARIGVLPRILDLLMLRINVSDVEAIFHQAIEDMRKLGAHIVDDIPLGSLAQASEWPDWMSVVRTDLRIGFEAFCANLEENPNNIHTIEDVVRWNDAHADMEKPTGCEDQSGLIAIAQAPGRDEAYLGMLHRHRTIALEAIRQIIETNQLDAIVFPCLTGLVNPWGRSGAPMVTVPCGFLPDDTQPHAKADGPSGIVDPFPGQPIGLSFAGMPWADAKLLGLAYAYEQATKIRQQRLPVPSAIPKAQIKPTADHFTLA